MEKLVIGMLIGGVAGAVLTANNYKMRTLVRKGQEEVQAKLDQLMEDKIREFEESAERVKTVTKEKAEEWKEDMEETAERAKEGAENVVKKATSAAKKTTRKASAPKTNTKSNDKTKTPAPSMA